MLKYTLEVEILIKSLISNHISKIYGIDGYLCLDDLDDKVKTEVKKKNEELKRENGLILNIIF